MGVRHSAFLKEMIPGGRVRRWTAICLATITAAAGWVWQAGALVQPDRDHPFYDLEVVDPLLRPTLDLEPIADVEEQMSGESRAAWGRFVASQARRGRWQAHIDRRSGLVEIAEGAGVPWIPGRGNDLTLSDVASHLRGRGQVDLATLESRARAFLPAVAPLLGTAGRDLRLDGDASGQVANYLWNVQLDVFVDGLEVEGARVFFRVNNGNLVQWGAARLPGPGAQVPKERIDRDEAFAILGDYIGGWQSDVDWLLDLGSRRLLPAAPGRDNPGYAFGRGYGLALVWELVFRRDGAPGTWRARIDATTGDVLEFRDLHRYAQVTGGYWPVAWRIAGVEQDQVSGGWPYVDVSPLGETSNTSGIYFWDGSSQSARHSGPYVTVDDQCAGAPGFQASDGSGNIAFGVITVADGLPGDCDDSQSGINDDSASARHQYYHVNKIMEKARTFYPSNSWLSSTVPVNVNINLNCNAFWSGSSLNFYQSGSGCGNTGEGAAISLHEWGHGFDSNDGSPPTADNGTGETYGDISAALQTWSSCIGNGFRLSGTCGGYGNSCNTCDGVRDIDWANHANNTPMTVEPFTRSSCPTDTSYVGPCGTREGHCESYVSSGAIWDFGAHDLQAGCSGRNATYPDWNCPGAGGPYNAAAAWSVADRLWYRSRSSADQAFTCITGGTYSSHGCNAGSNWKTMRAADDDDGNLDNGTPHSCQLAAAFGRHGVSCTSDLGYNVCFPGCTPPAAPTLSVTDAPNNQVNLSWSPDPSPDVIDIFRNEVGCNAGFTKIAEDASGTAYSDNDVSNGTTYYYQVVREPVGNEACGSAPSNCVSATPAATPSAVYVTDSATVSSLPVDLDADGFVDNCETGRVSFDVYNSGNAALSNVTATVTSSAAAVAITTSMPVNLGSLAVNGRTTGTFDFDLDGGICLDNAPFDIAVTADEMQAQVPPVTTTDSFSLGPVEIDPVDRTDDFETGNDGWTFSGGFARTNANAFNGSWAVASTNPADATCPESGGTASRGSKAISPTFTPTATSTVSLALRYDIEGARRSGPSFYTADKADVHLVNTDTGAHSILQPTGVPYTVVEDQGWWLCHITFDDGWNGQGASWPSYEGDAVFDLSPFAGGSYQLEVNYDQDGGGALGSGVWIDYVRWTALAICDGQSDTCAACTAPNLAGTVTATDQNACSTGVQVSWTDVTVWGDGGAGGRYYEIFRSTDGVSWTSAGIDPDLASPFVDTGATPGTPYYYRVRAHNTCGSETDLDTAGTTTDVLNGPVFAGLATVDDPDSCADSGVDLAWAAPGDWKNACASPGDCQFLVYRDAALIATLDDATLSYTDSGGTAGVTYAYRVEATNPSCANDGGATVNGTDNTGVVPTFGGLTSAADNGCDGVTLSWSAPGDWGDGGVDSQLRFVNVLRDGAVIASLAGGASSYLDPEAPLGVAVTYRVAAYNSCNLSSDGGASQGATNADDAPGPTFGGLQSAVPTAGSCSVDLAWNAASGSCSEPMRYNVYRDTTSGFTPGAGNRIATGVSGLTYTDAVVSENATFYYVVRAEELTDGGGPNGGKEEGNVVEVSATTGSLGTVTAYSESFDGCAAGNSCGWSKGVFGGSSQEWVDVRACVAQSSPNIFKFGTTQCTNNYSNDIFAFAYPDPSGGNGIQIPVTAQNTTLTFRHQRQFQSNDGGLLYLSLDGTSFTYLDASYITAGTTYGGSVGGLNGFTSSSTNYGSAGLYDQTTVDLDAACDLVSGFSSGCAGLDVYIGFTGFTDGSGSGNDRDGWFLDDVVVTYDAGTACDETPSDLQYQSATPQGTIGNGQVKVEWKNPTDEVYVKTKVVRKAGSAPADWTDGTAVNDTGTAGAYGFVFDTGLLTDGTEYFYTSYIFNTADDSGLPSTGTTVSVRPMDTGTPAESWAWLYATGAAAMVTPALWPGAIGAGAVFAVSNDRIVHGMNPDDVAGTGASNGSGEWLRSGSYDWTPQALNGISQHRPLVVPMTLEYKGRTTSMVLFLGAQDGRVYAIDGLSGQIAWTSAVLGDAVQASPGGFLASYGTFFDLLLAGTRNTASDNSLVGLDFREGTTKWTFDNGGGAGGIGILNGLAVDWPNRRAYFTSRSSTIGGSASTVWALRVSPGGTDLLWSVAVGDIDGEPVLANGVLYVGNTAGEVYALDPDNGSTNWMFDASTGAAAVKGFVLPEFGTNRLFVATDDLVWLEDQGGMAAELDREAAIASPSTPLWWFGTDYLYTGSSDGHLHEITLDRSGLTFLSTKSVQLGDGGAAIGGPAGDVVNKLIYVGAEDGKVYAVPAAPLP